MCRFHFIYLISLIIDLINKSFINLISIMINKPSLLILIFKLIKFFKSVIFIVKNLFFVTEFDEIFLLWR